MARFAIRSRFAGHPGHSAKTRHALRLKPDHSIGAGQMRLQERRNIAYPVSTHDPATVRAIADDVVVMQRGEGVEARPRAASVMRSHHPTTDILFSSVPEMAVGSLDKALNERGDRLADSVS